MVTITDEQATKNSIQYIAKREVEKVLCNMIDTEDGMTVEEILKSEKLERTALRASKTATNEIGVKQTIIVMTALVSKIGEDEMYETLVACCDEVMQHAVKARLYALKKLAEAKAARVN